MADSKRFRFSIDRGGTFTDVYAEVPGEPGYRVVKLLSEDPDHYPDAPVEGIRRVLEEVLRTPLPKEGFDASSVEWVRMGTTVATNALLERKGAKTALIITKGFADALVIGKQNRPHLFQLAIPTPQPLYSAVLEIDERLRLLKPDEIDGTPHAIRCPSGDAVEVLATPEWGEVHDDLQRLKDKGIESLAVVLLHAYAYDAHEKKIEKLAREVGFGHVSVSSATMPRIKLVDRGQTTVVDAALTPHIRRYLEGFRRRFQNPKADLLFMQSDGGLVRADRFKGSNGILSGPAGGVVGYAATGFDPHHPQPLIGFDMGGTSTDVSRFDGLYDWVQETEIAGVHLMAPQLDIRTVAAGGGSRLFFQNGMLAVGPESSGAHPGPVCYRKGGHLSLTDANLLLGRLVPEFFPHIFGPNHDEPLDTDTARRAFESLAQNINAEQEKRGESPMSLEAIALGCVEVANETMARPIRELSIARGHDVRTHALSCFGGAGGQHACAIARSLGIRRILIHRFAGILSAYGLALADVVVEKEEPVSWVWDANSKARWEPRLADLRGKAQEALQAEGFDPASIEVQEFLSLRYEGTDHAVMVRRPVDDNFATPFRVLYRREYGFELEGRPILIDGLRVRGIGKTSRPIVPPLAPKEAPTPPAALTDCYFKDGWQKTPVFRLESMGAEEKLTGPAILLNDTSTILVEPDCTARITKEGDVEIEVGAATEAKADTRWDPVQLALFSNRFMSIAEQMGHTLQRTAVSTNIKERQDFSCAVFDPEGGLVANAPHQPVHLGSMGEAVRAQIRLHGDAMQEGDVFLSNHPQAGGTHLPDMTVITPVFEGGRAVFFVASRGHHADIGGSTPGSMPAFSTRIEEEGAAVESFQLVKGGLFQEEALRKLLTTPPDIPGYDKPQMLSGTRALADNVSDLKAQIAANRRGIDLLRSLIKEYSLPVVHAYMGYIQQSAEMAVREVLEELYRKHGGQPLAAEDRMDDGTPIHLQVGLQENGGALFDFSGTGKEVAGNLNAPVAVTCSAVLYCLRCLVRRDIPLNQGCLNPVRFVIPEGSILNPSKHAAVAAGNVLTSQRVVDVVLKAFGAAAASQGCMNNLTFGNERFGYYETIGGGAGAGPGWHGRSGVHTHMTNTRITDPEILEKRYPVLLWEFSIRKGSGGNGRYRGGAGLVRELEFLQPLQVTLLCERRVHAPFGLNGGDDAARGVNLLLRTDGTEENLGGKNEINVNPGDRLRLLTPGGGGYGEPGF
ncbi:5-oxoprolinase [Nitrospina gracilis 3/211]|uniref:5-oxoprolinase n=1 Tax=Nitrospina gracilis (strain 3/211) TaxID=1266370 RepID=M1ZEP2_NITG3|nr:MULTISPECIES: hydantoinase B/oxoprolinase family protein [Nitrospina]MCF8724782.1 5-oxoprolinase (ATP-hydrolyzing) [Nitrospina sp. Nb-3]CCQ92057.1 5-oxoprolinase [Nitrospina gracilis 3/211]